jgi:glutamate dehydrogenase (NADP+)
MAQNSQRISWTREEVDGKLKDIMKAAFENGLKNAKEYVPAKEGEFPSLVAGSNIAGFVKVAVSPPNAYRSSTHADERVTGGNA